MALDEAKALGAGVAQSFDDYRRRCGLIEGLNAARLMLDAVHEELYGPEKEKKK